MADERTDAALLDQIRSTPWIADLLVMFDFDVTGIGYGPVEDVHLASGEPLEMIAADGSGGAFMLAGSGPNRPVVYVGSEGEGGLIATSLRDTLALVVGFSSIHDATALPYGEELRAWLVKTDEELRAEVPDLDADRRRLREALDLPVADDLLAALHQAAADDRYRPVNEEGDAYTAMLG